MQEPLSWLMFLAACFRWLVNPCTETRVKVLIRADPMAANSPKSNDPTNMSKITDLEKCLQTK
jgi:hypothetical protein